MGYTKDCPTCDGSGEVDCHDPDIPIEKCPKCHGTGKKTCKDCNGTGKVKA